MKLHTVKDLQKKLHYDFKDEKLLIEALTHKSYKKGVNNERLEYLGDAVIDLVVGEFLYKKFPKSNEGELSKMRASLVNEKGLTKIADELHLGEFIFISTGEENNNGRNKPSLLSNAFEAIIGAIYLESGLDTVKNIVYTLLDKVYPKIDMGTLFKDYKTVLQELTQALFGSTPEYAVIDSFGPDHNKEFEIAVFIRGVEYAKSRAASKKQAQQSAAKEAIRKLVAEENIRDTKIMKVVGIE